MQVEIGHAAFPCALSARYNVDRPAPIRCAVSVIDSPAAMSSCAVSRLFRSNGGLAPPVAFTGAVGSHTRGDTLGGQLALELREAGEHMEDQTTGGRGGVDVVVQTAQVHTASIKIRHHVEQVRQRPAETVQPPDHQSVAGLQVGQAAVEVGPRGLRA